MYRTSCLLPLVRAPSNTDHMGDYLPETLSSLSMWTCGCTWKTSLTKSMVHRVLGFHGPQARNPKWLPDGAWSLPVLPFLLLAFSDFQLYQSPQYSGWTKPEVGQLDSMYRADEVRVCSVLPDRVFHGTVLCHCAVPLCCATVLWGMGLT